MDFQLTEDQRALQAGVRSFCQGSVPTERLLELEKSGGFDRALFSELAELGIFGLCLTEERGGVGLGVSEAVIVFAELGRRAVPGPVLWSHLAAPFIEGAASGEVVVGGLDLADGGPLIVEHFKNLDALLVVDDGGIRRVDPKTLDATSITTPLDPLTPVHRVRTLPAGERVGDAAAAARLRLQGTALASGLLLGIAEETLELACRYALQRQQFGRPIGGFQAIKHILADMFVRQEVARAAAYATGATLDDPAAGDVERSVHVAKITAGESAMKNSRACIQVHGGMGFTWEIPVHYYLKRTWVLGNVFGTVDRHCDAVALRIGMAAA